MNNLFMFNDPTSNLLFVLVMVFWILPWKGYALWTAVKNNDKGWFIVLLIINTLGILEMVYLFGFAKKNLSDIKKAAQSILGSKKAE